jgi:hypothetical protein
VTLFLARLMDELDSVWGANTANALDLADAASGAEEIIEILASGLFLFAAVTILAVGSALRAEAAPALGVPLLTARPQPRPNSMRRLTAVTRLTDRS